MDHAPVFRLRVSGRARATLEELAALPPAGFARTVANLLSDRGFHYVQLRPTDDGPSVDILARDPTGQRVAVACRRPGTETSLRARDVRDVADRVTSRHGVAHGWVVTTSRVTLGARLRAARDGVHVVAGRGLARLVSSPAPAPRPSRRLEWTA